MRSWWRQRQPRERRLLQLGGFILLAAGAYGLLIQPALRAITLAEQRATAARQQAQTVAALAQTLKDLGGAARSRSDHDNSGDGQPTLFTRIDTLVRRSPLRTAVTRVQPQSADRVQLQLRQARFDVLIAQLQRIETQTDSRLDRLTLRREADAGIVSGTAEFSATATRNP